MLSIIAAPPWTGQNKKATRLVGGLRLRVAHRSLRWHYPDQVEGSSRLPGPLSLENPSSPRVYVLLGDSISEARRRYHRSVSRMAYATLTHLVLSGSASRHPSALTSRELVSSAPQISRALDASRVRPTALQSLGANWESNESQTQASLFPKPSTASYRQLRRRRGIRPLRRTRGHAAPAHESGSPVCGHRSRRWDGPALLRRH